MDVIVTHSIPLTESRREWPSPQSAEAPPTEMFRWQGALRMGGQPPSAGAACMVEGPSGDNTEAMVLRCHGRYSFLPDDR